MGVRRYHMKALVACAAAAAMATPVQVTDAQVAAALQACGPARTALVLSGGAAKGFAHIGVLRVLDSLGIAPDMIVGTSVGALVGALYASGYTAGEIDSLMRAQPISQVIRTYEPMVSSSLGLLKPLAVWERGHTGYRLQTGGAREGEVNALISSLTLRGNLMARGSFDSLPIPFRAVATDVVTQQARVLGGGDLAFAVRASVALPLVFQPVRDDTTWLIDGALSANVPIDLARSLGAERVWVSRLPSAPPDANAFDNPLTLTSQLLNTLIKDDTLARGRGDVEVVNPTGRFEQLNFDPAVSDTLVRIGYETAREAFGNASCIRPLSGGRASVAARAAALLPRQVGAVTLSGVSRDEPSLMAAIGISPGRPLDAGLSARQLARQAPSERIRAIWLNPEGSGPIVDFAPTLEPAPGRMFGMGVAFDQLMSGRLWIGGVDRSGVDANAEATLVARFGSYEQDVMGFAHVHTSIRGLKVPLAMGVRLAHESVRLFSGSSELPNAETQEGEFFAGVRADAEPGAWRYELMPDARLWREPGRDTRGSTGVRAAVFRARSEYEMGTIAEALVLADFQRLRLDASRVFTLSDVDVRVRVRAGWGNRLPIHHTFTLGGADGFAGFRISEMRGSQEAYAAIQLKRHIAPQLQVTAEGMAGAIGQGSGVLRRRDDTNYGKVYIGGRIGLEAATPIGPIRVEEGINNTGTRTLLVRVGYWF